MFGGFFVEKEVVWARVGCSGEEEVQYRARVTRMSVLKQFEVHIGIEVCTFMYLPGEVVMCSVCE